MEKARKILQKMKDKEEKTSMLAEVKKLVKPDAPSPFHQEARAPYEAEDVAAALPAGGVIGKIGKVTRTAKPFAEMAEKIIIRGEKAAPRLSAAKKILGRLTDAEKKAMESKGFYQLFKGK